jgi:hypothetical protein
LRTQFPVNDNQFIAHKTNKVHVETSTPAESSSTPKVEQTEVEPSMVENEEGDINEDRTGFGENSALDSNK